MLTLRFDLSLACSGCHATLLLLRSAGPKGNSYLVPCSNSILLFVACERFWTKSSLGCYSVFERDEREGFQTGDEETSSMVNFCLGKDIPSTVDVPLRILDRLSLSLVLFMEFM